MKIVAPLPLAALACALAGCGPDRIPEPQSSPATREGLAPPAVSGGHLEIGPDGRWMLAADPDRDQLYVVERVPPALRLNGTITLATGSEPGRVLVRPPFGFAVLRARSELLKIDLASAAVVARAETCVEPRGLDELDGALHVACAAGELYTHDGATLDVKRRVEIEPDLRDVVATGDRLYVSVFRSARVLELDLDGVVRADHFLGTPSGSDAALARVAWRMRRAPDHSVLILHQVATTETVGTTPGGYGRRSSGGPSLLCDRAVVLPALSRITPGEPPVFETALTDSGLRVDVAVSPTGEVSVASPSRRSPHRSVQSLRLRELSPPVEPEPDCSRPRNRPGVHDAATSVAYAPDGTLYHLRRDPAQLTEVEGPGDLVPDTDSVEDVGHDVFHGTTLGDLACASCHPEGGDDAHTWTFEGLGPRRTQNLRGGIMDSAPFHWDGEFETLEALMRDVFVERMSGLHVDGEEIGALGAWLDTLRPLATATPRDPPAADRGRALFDGRAGCAACHGDARRGGPGAFDVGTGGPLEVPALEGLRYRFPLMHDGCADTLADRFDPACGGADHGNVDGLSDAERADLRTYLRSI